VHDSELRIAEALQRLGGKNKTMAEFSCKGETTGITADCFVVRTIKYDACSFII